MEARKCARCGSMFISDSQVCGRCQTKDNADLYRLKGFIENQGIGEEIAQGELSIATGITNKNLARFLGYEEFKGVCMNNQNVATDEGKIAEMV